MHTLSARLFPRRNWYDNIPPHKFVLETDELIISEFIDAEDEAISRAYLSKKYGSSE